jgi:hypothetical protein
MNDTEQERLKHYALLGWVGIREECRVNLQKTLDEWRRECRKLQEKKQEVECG